MTERTIQLGLWANYAHRAEAIIPRFTPKDWWECDMWMCSKSMIATEFEIKISRGDFKADSKKEKDQWKRDADGKLIRDENRLLISETMNKHGLLASGFRKGPNRFYFAVPKDMIGVHEIPEWAGLIWFDNDCPVYRSIEVIKNAPQLHSEKVEPAMLNHVFKTGYWRYMRQIEKSVLAEIGKKS